MYWQQLFKIICALSACEELLKVSRFDKKYRPDKHGDILTIPRKIGFNRWWKYGYWNYIKYYGANRYC